MRADFLVLGAEHGPRLERFGGLLQLLSKLFKGGLFPRPFLLFLLDEVLVRHGPAGGSAGVAAPCSRLCPTVCSTIGR